MLYLLILSIIPSTNSHTPVNSSDIIIVGGHSDLQNSFFITTSGTRTIKTTTPSSDSEDELMKDDGKGRKRGDSDGEKEEVVFVPTARYSGNDGTLHEDTVRMSDVLELKRPDAMRQTEKPGDILFIQGKNNERQNSPVVEGRRNNDEGRREFKYIDYSDEDTTTARTSIPLDCTNLDCENNIESICGGKMERSEMKYRLFRNECFFRKVNCAFNYEMNRYQKVDLAYCKTVAAHVTRRTYDYPIYFPPIQTQQRRPEKEKEKEGEVDRRRFEGRRAMTMNLGSSYCGHDCPTICTEDYEPECALSALGERRVFLNHCKLDLNSCQNRMIWRRRPLAECTGGKKADLHQNRAFIDWLQRTGIVDKKGKLVLS